jgi:hypothetical protein
VVADKRLRIKGRFIKKEDSAKLLELVFKNKEMPLQNIKAFNEGLAQLITSHSLKKGGSFGDQRSKFKF